MGVYFLFLSCSQYNGCSHDALLKVEYAFLAFSSFSPHPLFNILTIIQIHQISHEYVRPRGSLQLLQPFSNAAVDTPTQMDMSVAKENVIYETRQ